MTVKTVSIAYAEAGRRAQAPTCESVPTPIPAAPTPAPVSPELACAGGAEMDSIAIERPAPEPLGEIFTDADGVHRQVLNVFNPATEHVEPHYERPDTHFGQALQRVGEVR